MEKTKKFEGIVPPTVTVFDSEGEPSGSDSKRASIASRMG